MGRRPPPPDALLTAYATSLNALRQDPAVDPAERARTCGLLAGLALRAMVSRDLAARLEAVERVLKLRQGQEREAQKRRDRHGR